jgi:predicted HicB family RNase H-like nuclease
MGRPKLLQNPARVNLVLDQTVNDQAMRMAQERGLSLGQFVAQLVNQEIKKNDGSQVTWEAN